MHYSIRVYSLWFFALLNKLVSAQTKSYVSQKYCEVFFQERILRYSGCHSIGDHFKLYWTFRETENYLDTLIVGNNSDYVAVGWGHSRMTPSNAAIGYKTKNNTIGVGYYHLKSYSSVSGVVKSDNSQLKDVDIEVEDVRISAKFSQHVGSFLPDEKFKNATSIDFIWAIGKIKDDAISFRPHSRTHRGSGSIILEKAKSYKLRNSPQQSGSNKIMLVHSILMSLTSLILLTTFGNNVSFNLASKQAIFHRLS